MSLPSVDLSSDTVKKISIHNYQKNERKSVIKSIAGKRFNYTVSEMTREYKLSKFSYIIEDDVGGIRMYNSLSGIYSLLYAAGDKKKKVYDIINDCNNSKWANDSCFSKLVELGYLIDINTDEIALARMKKMEVINQSGLLLTIMPTEDCNFRCEYCYEDHKKGEMPLAVQKAIVKFVRKNINNYTCLNIAWFGGEPLEAINAVEYLSKQFINICNVAKKNYSASITTNGYNLDKETFKKLQLLKVYYYQITIDGTKRFHDKYRHLKDGSGTFARITDNLHQIHLLPRNTFQINIRTNFTQENIEELSQHLAYCEELFGDDPRFSMFLHLVGNWGGDSVGGLETKLLTNDSYKNLLKDANEQKTSLNFKSHLIDLDPTSFKCYAGLKNAFVIGSDGSIYKCTEDFNMPENKIGHLDENGHMIIDQYKHAQWLDCTMEHESANCANCKYRGCCLEGPCPKAKIEYQNGHRNSYCPRTKNSVKDIIALLKESAFTIL